MHAYRRRTEADIALDILRRRDILAFFYSRTLHLVFHVTAGNIQYIGGVKYRAKT